MTSPYIEIDSDKLTFYDDDTGSEVNLKDTFNQGKNLIQNGAFLDSDGDDLPDFWALELTPTLAIAADTLFVGRQGNQITITNTGQGYEGIGISGSATNWLKVLPSTKYTFSIDYKVTADDFAAIVISSYNDAVAGAEHVNEFNLDSTTPLRLTYTFTTDADANNLSIFLRAKNDGDIVYFAHPKLEQGAIATPYIDETPLNYIQIDNYRKDLGTNPTGLFLHEGKNLIQHSAFWDINGDDLPVMWNLLATPTLVIAADTLFPSRGGNQITITGTGADNEGIQISGSATNWLKVLPSTTYIFSFDYECTAGDLLQIIVQSYNDAAAGTLHSAGAYSSTTPERISVTFTTDANANNLKLIFRANSDGDIVIVSHPKLEQGAIATPYILNEAEEQANIIQYYKPYARMYLNADQNNLADAIWTKILANATSFDLGSIVDLGNNKIVTPITGIYRIVGQVTYENSEIVANKAYRSSIYVNGAEGSLTAIHSAVAVQDLSVLTQHLAKIDENIDIELYGYQASGNALIDVQGTASKTYLDIELVTLDI